MHARISPASRPISTRPYMFSLSARTGFDIKLYPFIVCGLYHIYSLGRSLSYPLVEVEWRTFQLYINSCRRKLSHVLSARSDMAHILPVVLLCSGKHTHTHTRTQEVMYDACMGCGIERLLCKSWFNYVG